ATPLLTIANDLLLGLNWYGLWADEEGRLQSRRRIAPSAELPAARYTTLTEPKQLRGEASQRLPNTAPYKNRAAVAIDDPDRDPYTANWVNRDPTSPLSVKNAGKDDLL